MFFLTFFLKQKYYYNPGDNMKVKVFDESHEKDLEAAINTFLSEMTCDIIDIKHQICIILDRCLILRYQILMNVYQK